MSVDGGQLGWVGCDGTELACFGIVSDALKGDKGVVLAATKQNDYRFGTQTKIFKKMWWIFLQRKQSSKETFICTFLLKRLELKKFLDH